MNESALREEIVRFGRSLFDRGLTAGSTGNISVRLDDGWLLTPTNACLGNLDPALGDAIKGLAGKHSAVLLANHGPVVSGSSLEAAVYATEELEETAKLFLLLRNTATSPLNNAQIEELKTVFKLDF